MLSPTSAHLQQPEGLPARIVRINDPGTARGPDDLAALAVVEASFGVMVPKATPESVSRARDLAGSLVVPLIETAEGVLAAADVAASADVVRLAFGEQDLAALLGLIPSSGNGWVRRGSRWRQHPLPPGCLARWMVRASGCAITSACRPTSSPPWPTGSRLCSVSTPTRFRLSMRTSRPRRPILRGRAACSRQTVTGSLSSTAPWSTRRFPDGRPSSWLAQAPTSVAMQPPLFIERRSVTHEHVRSGIELTHARDRRGAHLPAVGARLGSSSVTDPSYLRVVKEMRSARRSLMADSLATSRCPSKRCWPRSTASVGTRSAAPSRT